MSADCSKQHKHTFAFSWMKFLTGVFYYFLVVPTRGSDNPCRWIKFLAAKCSQHSQNIIGLTHVKKPKHKICGFWYKPPVSEFSYRSVALNVTAKCLAAVFRHRRIPCSVLSPETGNPEILCGFLQLYWKTSGHYLILRHFHIFSLSISLLKLKLV